MKKYRVVEDLQGGSFGMGRDYTALEWLDCAVDWRDSDDSWGDWGGGVDCYGNKHNDSRTWFIKFWKRMIKDGKEQELIDYIADVWQLEFKEVKSIKVEKKGRAEKIKIHRNSKSKVYEIEYRYSDDDEYHNAYVVVYDSEEVGGGETIQHALDCANEDGDWVGVDILMNKMFGLTNGEINFYYDIQDAVWGLKTGLERSFDIYINDMWVERRSRV